MYVSQNNQKLYLNHWEFNACRLMSMLATVIEAAGGVVDYRYQKTALVCDRTVYDNAREKMDMIDHFKQVLDNHPEMKDQIQPKLEVLEKEAEELAGTPEVFVPCEFQTHLKFMINDTLYYYQVDDNPFMEFYYQKTPIVNGRYSKDACLMEASKLWYDDSFLKGGVSDADIKKAAETLAGALFNAPESEIIRSKKTISVPNTHNNGHHKEVVFEPERFSTELPQGRETPSL